MTFACAPAGLVVVPHREPRAKGSGLRACAPSALDEGSACRRGPGGLRAFGAGRGQCLPARTGGPARLRRWTRAVPGRADWGACAPSALDEGSAWQGGLGCLRAFGAGRGQCLPARTGGPARLRRWTRAVPGRADWGACAPSALDEGSACRRGPGCLRAFGAGRGQCLAGRIGCLGAFRFCGGHGGQIGAYEASLCSAASQSESSSPGWPVLTRWHQLR
jgi:hypothetical protein